MSNILSKFLNYFISQPDIKKAKINIYNKDYEKFLKQKYGICNKLNKNIKLLVIADTHGTLNEIKFTNYLKDKNYDICIMLGDHSQKDIDIVLKHIDKKKIYGILGNHDYDYLAKYKIPNLNGKIIIIKGIKILGVQGSFKYKKENFPSFTQEESIDFLNSQDKADILISHDQKFAPNKIKDPAHQGLIGITKYLYKNKIPIHIHGHIHETYEKDMLNKTKEYSVLGYQIINIKKQTTQVKLQNKF